MARLGYVAMVLMLMGCSASPTIDVAADAARASGVEGAIAFQHPSKDDNIALEESGVLTRDRAVWLAMRTDPRVQSAIARVRVAQADAQQARLLPNPILNVDVRFPEGGGSQIFEATLTGDLISVLSLPGRIHAADQRLRAAAADALTVVLDGMAEVLTSYVAVQAVDAEIVILDRRQQILKKLRDVANSRLNAGEGTRLDVLTLDAQQVQLELDIADKRLELSQQRLTLARLIGRPRSEARWDLEPWQGPALLHAPESTWIETALSKRPEIQSHAWELRALGEEVKLASLEPFQGGEVGAHGERDGSWVVGPTITTPLPIFDFGQAARAKAQALRDAAHHELNQQTNEVIEQVRRDYEACIVSRSSLEATQNRLVPLQEQQLSQAELAYRNGEADLTTLLLAENDLQESRSKLIELQEKLTDAFIQLERAAGGAGVSAALEQPVPTTSPATTPATTATGSTP